jgi:hypothetical protein
LLYLQIVLKDKLDVAVLGYHVRHLLLELGAVLLQLWDGGLNLGGLLLELRQLQDKAMILQ